MMNWAVGHEYIDRTPFRRGTETLIRKLREDNQRRRRISEDEEARLVAVAPLFVRSMLIAALDMGMRQGEMLALRVRACHHKLSSFCQEFGRPRRSRRRNRETETEVNSLDDQDLETWLAVRDDFRNWLVWACAPRNAMKIGAAQ